MAELKKITPSKLLWVDLEMTGLDPAKDRIVEVAAIVTDWDFKELATYEAGVRQAEEVLKERTATSPFWLAHADEAKQIMEVSLSGTNEAEVRANIIKMVNEHFAPGEPALLAGNSIHCDRGFIKQWWPDVEARLHYRMLDVSAWKVVMLGKYNVEFAKKETHRAMDDIRESIDELKFYLERAKLGQ